MDRNTFQPRRLKNQDHAATTLQKKLMDILHAMLMRSGKNKTALYLMNLYSEQRHKMVTSCPELWYHNTVHSFQVFGVSRRRNKENTAG